MTGLNRELSSPALLEGPSRMLDIAFTYRGKTIKHIRLNLGT